MPGRGISVQWFNDNDCRDKIDHGYSIPPSPSGTASAIMLGRSGCRVELGLPTQFHSLLRLNRYCLLYRDRRRYQHHLVGPLQVYRALPAALLAAQPWSPKHKEQREQPTSTTLIADSTWSPTHPAISVAASWRNSRAISECSRLGKSWLVERTGRGHKLRSPRTVPSA
jgi:hypothetical protein